MTQNEMVLSIMREDGAITSMDAIYEIGCTRLSARIWDIRNIIGTKVHSIWAQRKNRFGKLVSFKIYYLPRFKGAAIAKKKQIEGLEK